MKLQILSDLHIEFAPMDDFVAWTGAELWIHGHIHESFDYMISKTRVVCNPFGHIDEQNDGFNPTLALEI